MHHLIRKLHGKGESRAIEVCHHHFARIPDDRGNIVIEHVGVSLINVIDEERCIRWSRIQFDWRRRIERAQRIQFVDGNNTGTVTFGIGQLSVTNTFFSITSPKNG